MAASDSTSASPPHVRGAVARPLVWRLIVLCAAVALPLFGFAALVLTQYAQASRRQLERAGIEAVRDIADMLDRDIASLSAILQTLSYSGSLSAQDFATFHQTASRVAGTMGIPIVLSDREGNQIVNTRLPFGAPLPKLALPYEDVVQSRKVLVIDMFMGAVAQGPLYAIAAPVFEPDSERVTHVLNLSISPDRLRDLIQDVGLEPRAYAGVVDGKGRMMARTVNHEQFLGTRPGPFLEAVAGRAEGQARIVNREGQPILASFTRMKSTDWIVAHGLPVEVIDAPMRLLMRQLMLLGVTTVLAGGIGGFVLSRRLVDALSLLEERASEVGQGAIAAPVETSVTEINRLGARLADASHELSRARELKDALLYEVNHRVKNSLAVVTSLLAMQARQTRDANLKRGLEELRARVDVVASVHQRLYESDRHDRVDLGPFLSEIGTNMVHALAGGACQLRAEFERGIILRVDRTTPLALIVGELLTNAVKHGRREGGCAEIFLGVKRVGEGRISIIVADDGPGLPKDVADLPGGMGVRIIGGLLRQIRGTLETNAGEQGARFEITLDEGKA